MKKKRLFSSRFLPLIIILMLIMAVIASLVIAAYIKYSVKVPNTFSPADSVDPIVVEEKFDGKVKENVKFQIDSKKNPTNYPVYVRVKIVITWKDADGVVYYEPVKTTDYTMSLNLTDDGWRLGDDGYYYYQTPVESGKETDILVKSCQTAENAQVPEGYTLSVEFVVQTVQAVGFTDNDNPKGEIPAYQDAWENSPTLQTVEQ